MVRHDIPIAQGGYGHKAEVDKIQNGDGGVGILGKSVATGMGRIDEVVDTCHAYCGETVRHHYASDRMGGLQTQMNAADGEAH